MYQLLDQSPNFWVMTLFLGLPVAGLLAIVGYLCWSIEEDTREKTRLH